MAAGSRTPDSGAHIEIDTRFAAERWRYVCPRGHIDWRATPEGFVCDACEAEGGDGDAMDEGANTHFAALLDRRTRERVPRERVSVVETAVAAAYETGGPETEGPNPGDAETGSTADRASPRGRTGEDS